MLQALDSVEFAILRIPAFSKWNSARFAGDLIEKFYREKFRASVVDGSKLPEKKGRQSSSKIWISSYGRCHDALFKFLKERYSNPLSRPAIWFYWNGQGVQMGREIQKYRSLFGPRDRWIVSCQAEKAILDELYPNNNRTNVHFFPLPKKLSPRESKRALRKELTLPAKAFLALYAGRLSVQKNIHFLLQWLLLNPQFELVIAGELDDLKYPHLSPLRNYESYVELLNGYCQNKHLWSRLHIFPYLDQERLFRLMKACDLNISLSTHYGEDFGISVAQGILAGLPSVLTDWGGHKNWKSLSQVNSSIEWVPVQLNDRFLPVPLIQPVSAEILTKQPELDLMENFKKQVEESLKTSQKKTQSIRGSKELQSFWEKQYGASLFQTAASKSYQRIVQIYSQGSENQ